MPGDREVALSKSSNLKSEYVPDENDSKNMFVTPSTSQDKEELIAIPFIPQIVIALPSPQVPTADEVDDGTRLVRVLRNLQKGIMDQSEDDVSNCSEISSNVGMALESASGSNSSRKVFVVSEDPSEMSYVIYDPRCGEFSSM